MTVAGATRLGAPRATRLGHLSPGRDSCLCAGEDDAIVNCTALGWFVIPAGMTNEYDALPSRANTNPNAASYFALCPLN